MKNVIRVVLLGAVVVVLMGGGEARAAENALALAPVNAEFIFSINARQIADSALVKKALKEFGGEQAQAGIQVIKNLTGVDILKDLDRVTIWGRIKDDDSIVLVFQGKLNKDNLVTILKTNPEFAERTYKETKTYQWFDKKEKRMKYGAFLSDGSAVMANKKESLEATIDAQGKKDGFLTSEKAKWLPDGYKDASAWGVVVKPERKLPNGQLKDTLELASAAGTISLGDDKATVHAMVHTESSEAATKWLNLAQGGLALLQLQQENTQVRALAADAKVSIDADANRVTLELTVPNDTILNMIRKKRGH